MILESTHLISSHHVELAARMIEVVPHVLHRIERCLVLLLQGLFWLIAGPIFLVLFAEATSCFIHHAIVVARTKVVY